MSAKRPATTELNHDNWDQDDPDEHKDMGTFKPASKEAIEKRVIRTAKRRAQNSSEGAKQGVFSGFGGFSKVQPSSFDFLANLTNGSKPVNGSPSSKTDPAVSTSGFNNTSSTTNAGGGLFTLPVSSSSSKTIFNATSQSSSLFGGSVPTSSSGVFTASKADSTVGSFSFKAQTHASKPSDSPKTESTSVVTSTMFGIPPNNTEAKKSLFSTAPISSPFKTKSEFNSNTLTANPNVASKTENKTTADKSEESDKKMRYYTKLKGLNESVSDWIKQHVEKTPLCILSPIFKDYEKHLKEIQAEYQGSDSDDATKKHSGTNITVEPKIETIIKSSPFTGSSSLFSNSSLKTNSTSPFSTQSSPNSFGEKGSNSNTVSATSSPPKTHGFSFGISSSPKSTTLTTNSTASTPFSFGVGKPFSINNFNTPKPAEAENDGEDADDEPPKAEYTPIVEKDSVYEKKCKIFVKKDGNFADRGVGTLYIKKIEDSGKYQLLVRANTNLGNVLLNLILASAIPTQRMGKNNVMMVCIPTPDAKPPPTSILIRVKTTEEADELLETLDKYKK